MSAVDEIVQHGYLVEYLHELTQEPWSRYTDEFPVAYRHPNGFTKIRLTTLDDYGWTIRLHVWAERASDYDIHSHCWNFASRILAGSLTEETYTLAAGAGKYSVYNCSPSVGGQYSLKFQHKCDVNLVSKDVYQQGASYERDAKTLHAAYADSACRGVTVFVQGPERERFTTVIRPPSLDGDRKVVASRYDPTELMNLLREVVSLIDRS
jgi:hypothetical protein